MYGSIISTVDSNFILQLKCLRTLNLRKNGIIEVPKEIGELKHLRHVDLSRNDGLKILLESICELYNLYTLRLYYCRSLEKGIRRLQKLRTIEVCVVVCDEDEDKEALQLGDLRGLNLEGRLSIILKGNVKDESEIEKAKLWHMKQLFHLGINSYYVQYKQTSSTVEILNVLRPHENLESLSIRVHSGATCPQLDDVFEALEEWEVGVEGWNKEDFEISIMPCLSSLEIRDCHHIKTLPDFLCNTPLQDLTIYKCSTLSKRCEQGSGEEWPKISHIPNIKINI
ncbi:disease resistance protein RGA2-like [Pyrus x bretschneideri]|uniref:disease resistance protein RGA2-like n=1 Tax=Pyrus x bretschneideri TaxID=225117 RepID=UPI00202E9002|nr:disease resistance protein RGA2-like [Pyrus x bretschneideri]